MNRYAPPQADLELQQLAAAPSKAKAGFPFSLVLRWVLAGALMLLGASRLFSLSQRWSTMIGEMVYGPEYSPYPWLALELCILVAGVLLWFRSKWVFVPVLMHIVLLSWKVLSESKGLAVPALVYVYWCKQTLVLAFCLFLLSRGRLR